MTEFSPYDFAHELMEKHEFTMISGDLHLKTGSFPLAGGKIRLAVAREAKDGFSQDAVDDVITHIKAALEENPL